MKNVDLSKKIKELRTRNGFSQEELSRKSELNLRTIQRIESGETDPRGDSLKRLAIALNVTPDELIEWTETEDKNFLAFLNLSALSFFAFPLLGVIIPLALWIFKKDKIKYLNETGKRLLNFQISWCILVCTIYVVFFAGILFHVQIIPFADKLFSSIGGQELLLLCMPLLYLLNIVLILVNTVLSYKGKEVFYQPAIRFLK